MQKLLKATYLQLIDLLKFITIIIHQWSKSIKKKFKLLTDENKRLTDDKSIELKPFSTFQSFPMSMQ